jgi:flagellar basal-body rod protein FlgB
MNKLFLSSLTVPLPDWRNVPVMDPTQIGLFHLAERRLAWADQRQALLAKNIANVSTPSYRPQDLQPFEKTLSNMPTVEPVQTQPNHMSGTGGGLSLAQSERPKGKAPDGNAVTLDEELVKVANTETTQTLVTTIYKKYFNLFNIALGRSQ